MNLENLTEGERFIVMWQYRILGDFKSALIEAIARADTSNRSALAKGFPVEVEAYTYYTEISGWWDAVEKKALGTCPSCRDRGGKDGN